LAEKTVKNYVSNLLTKMGIGHRAGAAAHFARAEGESRPHYPPSQWRAGTSH
jgi:DNA-binding NarL/FixJ family response regulator